MCVFCKGKLIPATTDYIEKIGNYVVIIKNVPCEKCEQCGEEYFKKCLCLKSACACHQLI